MNNINLIGRLTTNPVIKAVGPGQNHPMCEMRMAYDQAGKETGYINVVVWGKLAQACGDFLTKGDELGVGGRLDYGEWTDRNDRKRSGHKITAQGINFLRKAKRAGVHEVLEMEDQVAAEQALDAARSC